MSFIFCNITYDMERQAWSIRVLSSFAMWLQLHINEMTFQPCFAFLDLCYTQYLGQS